MKKIFVISSRKDIIERVGGTIVGSGDLNLCGCSQYGEIPFDEIDNTGTDIIIVSYSLPEVVHDNLVELINLTFPEKQVIVVSEHCIANAAKRCIESGASAFIIEGEMEKHLINAIHTVSQGGVFVSDKITADSQIDLNA